MRAHTRSEKRTYFIIFYFETIDRGQLLKKMGKMEIKNKELKWFESYLSDRKQSVKIGDIKSSEISNDIGTPQGSVLGAILFNDLPSVMEYCEINLFADDTLIFCHGKNLS